jgi:phage gp36-like protein
LYARLTDRVNGASADENIAQEIVDQAEAEANTHLAARYSTPINLAQHAELADVFRRRVLDLAECLAWRASPFVSDLPNRVNVLHDDAQRWFQHIAAGELRLPAAREPRGKPWPNDRPRYVRTTRPFTADELEHL